MDIIQTFECFPTQQNRIKYLGQAGAVDKLRLLNKEVNLPKKAI